MDELGIGVAGDQKHAIGRTGGDQPLDHGQGVDEARAAQAAIHHSAIGPETQAPVQQGGVPRQGVVRRLGAEHHKVDLGRIGPGLGQEFQRGLLAEIQCRLVHAGDVALADAGLVDDLGRVPARVELGQDLAGQHPLGELARDR